MPELSWSKDYYETPGDELKRLVPEKAKTILSLGCGWGATEALLKRNGTQVTALPVDSVIGVVAEQRGIEVIYGTLDEGLKKLAGRKFDCILIADLLHLLPEQERVVQACHGLLEKGGTLLISGPNFGQLPTLLKRVAGKGEHRKLRSFKQSGINISSPNTLVSQARKAGFQGASVKWFNHALPGRRLARVKWELGGITAKNWIIQAKR